MRVIIVSIRKFYGKLTKKWNKQVVKGSVIDKSSFESHLCM